MTLTVRSYGPEDAETWDAFCSEALQGTLLHSRRFLSYHGDRFRDLSLILDEDNAPVGLFPAAEQPGAPDSVTSHPGITYGGILHRGRLQGDRMISALQAIANHYADLGFRRLLYKVVPAFYYRAPAADDVYALFRLGAEKVRCDLSSTIDLSHRLPVGRRRRRGLKQGQRAGLSIVNGPQHIPELWAVIEETLARRHGVRPVHSLAQITLLAASFPEEIRCTCAALNGRILAGTILFLTPVAHHAQYIASSPEGNALSALDTVFDHCIAAAQDAGVRWFDFGISTEQMGQALNDGLYTFKSEFGGGGTVHEFYELTLQP